MQRSILRCQHPLFEREPLSVPLVCSASKDGDIPEARGK